MPSLCGGTSSAPDEVLALSPSCDQVPQLYGLRIYIFLFLGRWIPDTNNGLCVHVQDYRTFREKTQASTERYEGKPPLLKLQGKTTEETRFETDESHWIFFLVAHNFNSIDATIEVIEL
jgi:hypothetical protein